MEKTRRERTAVSAGAEMKGPLMFGIINYHSLLIQRELAEGDGGLRQRVLPIKWLQRPFLRGYGSALCPGQPLAPDWQSDSRGDQINWLFGGLKVCISERSRFRGEGLSVPTPPSALCGVSGLGTALLKGELKNFVRKQSEEIAE